MLSVLKLNLRQKVINIVKIYNLFSMKVQLYIYDLSQGMAKALSPMLLGKQIDGVWHTSIVLHEEGGKRIEYFYSSGIQKAPAGTPFVEWSSILSNVLPTDPLPKE